MLSRIPREPFSRKASLLWLAGLIVILCPVQLRAEKTVSHVVIRENVPASHREELTSKLKTITGWTDLRFDSDGSLQLGAKGAVSGSQGARELLAEATSSPTVIVLEDASDRSDVVFCRVVPGTWIHDASQRPPAYVILIDFADFRHLAGDEPARNAFDVGWAILHELDHVVNDSRDASAQGGSGECEDHINAMRRELNLPERRDYFFTFFPPGRNSTFATKLVRLAFDRHDVSHGKRRYWLIWDASAVGGLDEQKVASLK
jgi:hypothetical protein